jgi:hypothetical protein
MATDGPDFIVLGLPRSGTAWLSVWLDCHHDPQGWMLPEQIRGGMVCTGAHLLPSWLQAQRCPVAIIERDHRDCDVSLRRIGLVETTARERELFAQVEGRRWRFADIWEEDKARELWAFLVSRPFDADRYHRLKRMRIELREHTTNLAIAAELLRRGLLEVP